MTHKKVEIKNRVEYSEREKREMISHATKWISIRDTGFAAIILYAESKLTKVDAIAFTNGKYVYYGDDYFQLPDFKMRAGVTVHEVLHIALRHCQRLKHRNGKLYNIAADAVINYSIKELSWLTLPEGCVDIEKLIDRNFLEKIPPAKWNTDMVYDYLIQKAKDNLEKQLGKNKDCSGKGNKTIEEEIEDLIEELAEKFPGMKGDMHKPEVDESGGESEIEDMNWSKRLARAAAGTKAGSILRRLLDEFPTSETPWQNLLRRFMKKACLPQTQENWGRPSRTMLATKTRIFTPGIKPKDGLGNACVIVDTSGSIDDGILTAFAAEVQAIQKQTGANIDLIFGDTCVQARHLVKNDGQTITQKIQKGQLPLGVGGGGTDMRVLIAEAKKSKPTIVIVLSDGFTPYPESFEIKGLNLIWALYTDVEVPVGCGKVIRIKI